MTHELIAAIAASGLTIYDSLKQRPDLLIPTQDLERILNDSLCGFNLNYPLRTRSKVLKQKVCQSLGYPVPKAFCKTRPRFPGQNFDTYIQKADNLQVWNEELSPSRRYVLVRVDACQIVTKVRVVGGDALALLDTTGTLTQKYQAKSREPVSQSHLVSKSDTVNCQHLMKGRYRHLLAVTEVFERLQTMIGSTFNTLGADQERNRGGVVHRAVSECLGATTPDNGQFPDVLDQLLEVKLQTASTIDLGLVCPDSTEPLASLPEFQHRDVRYAVFYGVLVDNLVRLDQLVLSTGADFFSFFQRFEGKITNAKRQLHLPSHFFS